MKTKEQLADEHINDEYPKDLYSTDERSDAQMTFLAGYDARDAQLKELPEFDETILREAYLEREDIIDDLTRWEALSLGARWQHQQDAKVIANLTQEANDAHNMIHALNEKIRELEKLANEIHLTGEPPYYREWQRSQEKLQAANLLIDELERYFERTKANTNSNKGDWHRAIEALEKIKQYKESGK